MQHSEHTNKEGNRPEPASAPAMAHFSVPEFAPRIAEAMFSLVLRVGGFSSVLLLFAPPPCLVTGELL